jgi:ribosome-binding factor A
MVYPEERMGVDNVMSCMVTVADVEVSGDLQVVKVFVSILGDERGKKNAINGLKKMEGYVRRNIGKRVSLRLTPDIRFVYDDSFERGQRVSSLLDELRVEREVREAGGGRYTQSELLAVEDTITNPYGDDEDSDLIEELDELVGEEGEKDEDDDEDIDIEADWDELQKNAD